MSPRRHAGFTLVELMVAMTIGLLLMALIATLFLTNSRTYATT
ncbi:MAG: PilW family protein, partial [Burkholderiales bacterium]